MTMQGANVGSRVEGNYYGHQFTGAVTRFDPDWTQGSRGTIHFGVKLDAPFTHNGTLYEDLYLLSVNERSGQIKYGNYVRLV